MKRALLAGLALAALAGGGALLSTKPVEGCGAKCCRRPAGAPVEACMRKNPHSGVPEDFGELNTMPGTHAVGGGCEPTECVQGAGIEWLDGGVQ